MDNQFREYFISKWNSFFAGYELPICYFYTDNPREEDIAETAHEERCLIGNLKRVREGCAYVYDAKSPGCPGGKRYTGFIHKLRPNFEYFLSCGIPGKLEGERYKKSPELVQVLLEKNPPLDPPGNYLVFKRFDRLTDSEQPAAVIFFATPDVLSGLFTLANYDYADTQGVIAPMGAGCSSIVYYPLVEARSAEPRCVLGMFDVSARPCVPAGILTFTVPAKRFEQMVRNMEGSFLITESWGLVKGRL